MEDLRLRPASLCPERGCDSLKDAHLSTLRLEPELLKFPHFYFPVAHRERAMFCSPETFALCFYSFSPPSPISVSCDARRLLPNIRPGAQRPQAGLGCDVGERREGRRGPGEGTGSSLLGRKLPMQGTRHSAEFLDMLLSLVLPGASHPRPPQL